MCTAGCAASKERNRMPLNREVCLLTERGELLYGDTDIHIDHAVAGSAGQVVMVLVASAYAITMRAIGELDAIKQASIDQHLHRTINGSAPKARLFLTQILPEIIHGKVSAALCQLDQTLSNHASRTRIALALLVEHGINLFCNHGELSFLLVI